MIGLIEMLGIALAIAAFIFMASNYITSTHIYQAISDSEQSSNNLEPWRWQQPNPDLGIKFSSDIGLKLKDGEIVSSLILPRRYSLGDFIVHFLGYFLIGTAFWTLISSLIQKTTTPSSAMIGFIFIFGFGWICLQVGDRLYQIDLYRDRVEFITKYAFFFYRKQRYQRHHQLKFKGQRQSFWGMDRSQAEPDYKIAIVQPILGIFHQEKTFFAVINPTQGSWIVEGLKYWNSLNL